MRRSWHVSLTFFGGLDHIHVQVAVSFKAEKLHVHVGWLMAGGSAVILAEEDASACFSSNLLSCEPVGKKVCISRPMKAS